MATPSSFLFRPSSVTLLTVPTHTAPASVTITCSMVHVALANQRSHFIHGGSSSDVVSVSFGDRSPRAVSGRNVQTLIVFGFSGSLTNHSRVQPGATTFPPVCALWQLPRAFSRPTRFPQVPFQYPRSRTATLEPSRVIPSPALTLA